MKYLFMYLGLLLCVVGTIGLFKCNSDRLWVEILMGGFLVACIGFYVDAKSTEPRNHYQFVNRRSMMRTMTWAILLTLIFMVIILFI